MFFAAGVTRAAAWLPTRIPYRARAGALGAAAACVFLATSFAVPQKGSYGFAEVAESFVRRSDSADTVVLVSSEGNGEGMLVAEMAMRDHRPGWIVLRATKTLASVTWVRTRYQENFPTPLETQDYLQRIPVSFLVIDKGPGAGPLAHHRNLLKMLAMYPDRWRFLGAYPQKMRTTAPDSRIEVYQLIGQEKRERGRIRLDLRYTLGRWIER
jgi:hypothetical protein